MNVIYADTKYCGSAYVFSHVKEIPLRPVEMNIPVVFCDKLFR